MIDLIAIEYSDRKEMSLAIVGEGIPDVLKGPVPFKDAVSALAPILAEALPDRYTVDSAKRYLMVVHFRNITQHHNSSGQSYPWVCK
jgi:hypothetical protein